GRGAPLAVRRPGGRPDPPGRGAAPGAAQHREHGRRRGGRVRGRRARARHRDGAPRVPRPAAPADPGGRDRRRQVRERLQVHERRFAEARARVVRRADHAHRRRPRQGRRLRGDPAAGPRAGAARDLRRRGGREARAGVGGPSRRAGGHARGGGLDGAVPDAGGWRRPPLARLRVLRHVSELRRARRPVRGGGAGTEALHRAGEAMTQALARDRRLDLTLLLPVVCLVALGVVMVFSSSATLAADRYNSEYYFLKRHAVRVLFGLVALLWFARLDYRVLQRVAPWAVGGTVLLLGVLLAVGGAVRGANR